MGALANSEDLDEMSQNALFVQTKSIFRERNTLFGNCNLGPFNSYTKDHPDLTSNLMANCIGLHRVNAVWITIMSC